MGIVIFALYWVQLVHSFNVNETLEIFMNLKNHNNMVKKKKRKNLFMTFFHNMPLRLWWMFETFFQNKAVHLEIHSFMSVLCSMCSI